MSVVYEGKSKGAWVVETDSRRGKVSILYRTSNSFPLKSTVQLQVESTWLRWCREDARGHSHKSPVISNTIFMMPLLLRNTDFVWAHDVSLVLPCGFWPIPWFSKSFPRMKAC